MDQRKTPLYDKLVVHSAKKTVSFHVPGHKNGTVFPEHGKEYYHDMLKLDLTELTGMDDLHHPTGVIAEAQKLAANLYNTSSSHFLVGGTTVGNLAMLMSCFTDRDTIFVQRNSHQSIFHGIELARLNVVYLEPEVDDTTGLTLGISINTLKEAIRQFPHAKGLVVTNPTYEGYGQDLVSHVMEAHKADMLVLVDEAHGAHLVFDDERWPQSSLRAGADMVVQSTHKMLPSMTMTSMLHINSTKIDKERVALYLKMLQSSSPSYPLMASLDLARAYLASFKKNGVDYLTERLLNIKNIVAEITAPTKIASYVQDPLKLVLFPSDGLTTYNLQKQMEVNHLFPELVTPTHLLLTLALTNDEKYYEKCYQKLSFVLPDTINGFDKTSKIIHNKPESKFSKPDLVLADIDKMPIEYVPWKDAAGRVAAETITPYPPGIPLIIKGERISTRQVERLNDLLMNQAYFQTGLAWKDRGISVAKQ